MLVAEERVLLPGVPVEQAAGGVVAEMRICDPRGRDEDAERSAAEVTAPGEN